jgi:hypothetical protein
VQAAAASLVWLAAVTAQAATVVYTVTPLTAGNVSCIGDVTSVDASGTVTGTANFPGLDAVTTGGVRNAFVWSVGAFSPLAGLAAPTPGATGDAGCATTANTYSEAAASTPTGMLVGTALTTTGPRAVVWPHAADAAVALGSLCEPPGSAQPTPGVDTSAAYAANGQGLITGTSTTADQCTAATPLQSPDAAVLTTLAGPMRVIATAGSAVAGGGVLAAGQISGVAINTTGQVVVTDDNAGASGQPTGYLYTPSAPDELQPLALVPIGTSPALAATLPSSALAGSSVGPTIGSSGVLNDAGVIVGVTTLSPTAAAAAYTQNAAAAVTLPPADGLPQSAARAVNNQGDIVGSSFNAATGRQVATLWHDAAPPAATSGAPATATDLNTLVNAGGVTLNDALAISDTGVIVAYATTDGGQGEIVELARGGATLRGDVTIAATHAPTATARILLSGRSATGATITDTLVTGADGAYADRLGAGVYTVTATGSPPGAPPDEPFAATRCDGAPTPNGCVVTLADADQKTASFAYGVCGPLTLNRATPQTPLAFGATPGSVLVLRGAGFCPGITVAVGNQRARVTLDASMLAGNGTTARVVVPPFATSGSVTISQPAAGGAGADHATLAGVAIDSFRNTGGFAFAATPQPDAAASLVDAFGPARATTTLTVNACRPGRCPLVVSLLTPPARALAATAATSRDDAFGMAAAAVRLAADTPPVTTISHFAASAYTTPPAAAAALIAASGWAVSSDAVTSARIAAARADRPAAAIIADLAAHPQPALVSLTATGPAPRMVSLVAYQTSPDPVRHDRFLVRVYDPHTPYTQSEQAPDGARHAAIVSRDTIHLAADGSWSYQPPTGRPLRGSSRGLVVIGPQPLAAPTLPNHRMLLVLTAPGTRITSLRDPKGRAVTLQDPYRSGVVPLPQTSTRQGDWSFAAPLASSYQQTVNGSPLRETLIAPGLVATISAGETRAATISVDPLAAQITISRRPGWSATLRISLCAATPSSDWRCVTVTTSAPAVRVRLDRRRFSISVTNTSRRGAGVTAALADTPPHRLGVSFQTPPLAVAAGAALRITRPRWATLPARLRVDVRDATGATRPVDVRDTPPPPAVTLTTLTNHAGRVTATLRTAAGSRDATLSVTLLIRRAGRVVASRTVTLAAAHPTVTTSIPVAGVAAGTTATVLVVTLPNAVAAPVTTLTRTIRVTPAR